MKKYSIFAAIKLVRLTAIACIFLFSTAATVNNNYDHEEAIKAGYFKTYNGIETFFSNDFDFDAQCDIQSFELMYQPRRKDVVIIPNKGETFNLKVRNAVKNAKPGDTYVFHNIKCRCDGDAAARKLPSMVVKIR